MIIEMKRASLISKNEFIYTWIVFLALTITTLLASLYGMLSPDSMSYLALAESVQRIQECSISGKYYAIQPCGYSILVATMGNLAGVGNLIIASKLLNWALMFSSFFLLKKTMPSQTLAALMIVNPLMLYILQYTWTENLFLFSFVGCFCILKSIARSGLAKYKLILLTAFLIVGCSSRYFFAPFALIIWIASYLSFGGDVAKKTLLAFIISGIFFVVYQKFNIYMTGYSTGMQRIPAPESIHFLGILFVWSIIKYFLIMVFVTAPLYFYSIKKKGDSDKLLITEYSSYQFLLLSGLGFLMLAFILRSHTQYDLFDIRTIGFGIVFIFIGVLGLKVRNIDQLSLRKKVIALIFLFAASFFLSISITGWIAIFSNLYTTPSDLIEGNRSTVMNQAIVAFDIPSPSFFIAGTGKYYHDGTQIISVAKAPYSKQDDYDSFINKLEQAPKDCVLDFSSIPNLEKFEQILSSTYAVDLKFIKSYTLFEKVLMPSYNLELKKFLVEIFKPKTLLSCEYVLSYSKKFSP